MTMRPVPNEGHSNAAHWHAKWKAADAELDTLRRQLAEAQDTVRHTGVERDSWKAAADRSASAHLQAEAKLAEAEEQATAAEVLATDRLQRAELAEAKLALAEQDSKRLDYMLHWHATTLTDGNGWRVAFEYTSPATYATIKKYQTQREAIDAAMQETANGLE